MSRDSGWQGNSTTFMNFSASRINGDGFFSVPPSNPPATAFTTTTVSSSETGAVFRNSSGRFFALPPLSSSLSFVSCSPPSSVPPEVPAPSSFVLPRVFRESTEEKVRETYFLPAESPIIGEESSAFSTAPSSNSPSPKTNSAQLKAANVSSPPSAAFFISAARRFFR